MGEKYPVITMTPARVAAAQEQGERASEMTREILERLKILKEKHAPTSSTQHMRLTP